MTKQSSSEITEYDIQHKYNHPIEFNITLNKTDTGIVNSVYISAIENAHSTNNAFFSIDKLQFVDANNIKFKSSNGILLTDQCKIDTANGTTSISKLLNSIIDNHMTIMQRTFMSIALIVNDTVTEAGRSILASYGLIDNALGMTTSVVRYHIQINQLVVKYTSVRFDVTESRNVTATESYPKSMELRTKCESGDSENSYELVEYTSTRLVIIPAMINMYKNIDNYVTVVAAVTSMYEKYGFEDMQFLLDNKELIFPIENANIQNIFVIPENSKFTLRRRYNRYTLFKHRINMNFSVVGQRTAFDYLRWRKYLCRMELECRKYPSDCIVCINQLYPEHSEQLIRAINRMRSEISPEESALHRNFRVCNVNIKSHRKQYNRKRKNDHCCSHDKLVAVGDTVYSIGMDYGD